MHDIFHGIYVTRGQVHGARRCQRGHFVHGSTNNKKMFPNPMPWPPMTHAQPYAIVTHVTCHGKGRGISYGWPHGTCTMAHSVKRNRPCTGYARVYVVRGDVHETPHRRPRGLVHGRTRTHKVVSPWYDSWTIHRIFKGRSHETPHDHWAHHGKCHAIMAPHDLPSCLRWGSPRHGKAHVVPHGVTHGQLMIWCVSWGVPLSKPIPNPNPNSYIGSPWGEP